MVRVKFVFFYLILTFPLFLLLTIFFYKFGVLFFLLFSMITIGFGYLWADQILLKFLKIRPINECKSGPLYDIVANVSYRYKTPPPKIFFYKLPTINTLVLKGMRDGPSLFIFHEDILKYLTLDKLEVLVMREIMKLNSSLIRIKILETLFCSLTFYLLDKWRDLLNKVGMEKTFLLKAGSRLLYIFNLLVYSYTFFYIYLLTRIFNINKQSARLDRKVIQDSKNENTFAVVLEQMYKLNKEYMDKNFIGRLFFIYSQGEHFSSFLKIMPSIEERYSLS